MCKETISIAQCAPENPPALSFTCGKLHMIALERKVCENAMGSCVCFFGTCGAIEKVTPSEAIDYEEMYKIRCSKCTSREDTVGDRRKGRDITDSPLLDRKVLTSEAEKREFMIYMRKQVWVDGNCPFHTVEKTVPVGTEPLTCVEPALQEKPKAITQPGTSPQAGTQNREISASTMKKEHTETEVEGTRQDPQTPPPAAAHNQQGEASLLTQVEETLGRDMHKLGLKCSAWANKPTSHPRTRITTPHKYVDEAVVPVVESSNVTTSSCRIEENETSTTCSSLMKDAKMFLNGL